MKTVFADAFYFVGLVNRADQHHDRIVAAARQLRDEVLTTEWILAEFADAWLNPPVAVSSRSSSAPWSKTQSQNHPRRHGSFPARSAAV